MKILETDRLILREAGPDDAAFVLDLLNQPSFKKYIGDRGVRTVEQARAYISERLEKSYRENGFGMWVMELKTDSTSVGLCGFVNRPELPDADIGFALLPQFEKQGYAFEAAQAAMDHGRETLKLPKVLAITTLDNERSGRLLQKIGLNYEREIEFAGETLRLFSSDGGTPNR